MNDGYQTGEVYRIPCEQWYVVDPPIWEDSWHHGRNWLAKIESNPLAPGGFTREWCERGKGCFRYSTTALLEGDLIEFGADYVAWSGNRTPLRWYGEVVGVTETELQARYFESAEELFATWRDREARTVEAVRPESASD